MRDDDAFRVVPVEVMDRVIGIACLVVVVFGFGIDIGRALRGVL